MPRTRPELEREDKVAEIVAAAERRLREGGYDALSVAADFVARLDATWRHMLAGVLRGRLQEPELSAAVAALIATIQGAFLQPMSAAERRRVVAYAVERLVPPR